NKVAAPFREAEFDIMYGEGISYEGDVLDLATQLGLVEKRGAFYRYAATDELLGQGRENAKQYLKEHPEVVMELDQAIRQTYSLSPVVFSSADGDIDLDA
ncbi:MAG TPA: recombinase RecA, partial [Aggregatilineales bacterium]|nr:recombinase RecA [Aggregatilineales bacterium]